MNAEIFLFESILDTIKSTGNSINGPIISANDINSLSEKVATAIANAIGEFLVRVVKFNAIESSLVRFMYFPIKLPNTKFIAKNNSTCISNCKSTSD